MYKWTKRLFINIIVIALIVSGYPELFMGHSTTAYAASVYGIKTIAGIGGESGYNGDYSDATEAKLGRPQSVVTDVYGNVYVADVYNFIVRKIDSQGAITTIAGTPKVKGFDGDGGQATDAVLGEIEDIALDSHGNLYIAAYYVEKSVVEKIYYSIRKVDASGIISTVLNDESYQPSRIAVDDMGNIYFAEYPYEKEHRILKIDLAGNITVVIEGLSYPMGLAVDRSGSVLYVNGQAVYKMDSSGAPYRVAGTGEEGYSGDGGQAIDAKLSGPQGLETDTDGNLFIADSGNHVIRKVDSNGIITTIIGSGKEGYSGDHGLATHAQLSNPTDVAVDGAGNVYVSERYNYVIRKAYPYDDTTLSMLTISNGVLNPAFSPDVKEYNVYVPHETSIITLVPTSDYVHDVITVNELPVPSGQESSAFPLEVGNNTFVITVTPAGGTNTQHYTITVTRAANIKVTTILDDNNYKPQGIAVDQNNNLYIVDPNLHQILIVDTKGRIATIDSQLVNSDNIAIDLNGNVYFTHYIGQYYAVSKIDTNGVITEVVKKPNTITGIAVDADGNLYVLVVDSKGSNTKVYRFGTDFTESHFAGEGNSGYNGNVDSAIEAKLKNPQGITLDRAGNLYIVDTGNHIIRKVDTEGRITTVAGTPETKGYSGDGGPATAATLNSPRGVAIDNDGSMYITDYENLAIRKVDANGIITTVPESANQLNKPVYIAVNKMGAIYVSGTNPKNDGRLIVKRLKEVSSNAKLSGLELSTGIVSPGFDAEETIYTVKVPNAVTRISATPTTVDPDATVVINGKEVESGQASESMQLNVGTNTIQVQVTAEDGTEKTYTITVTRAAAPSGGNTGGGDTPTTPDTPAEPAPPAPPTESDVGTVTTTKVGGQTVAAVKVDADKLQKLLTPAPGPTPGQTPGQTPVTTKLTIPVQADADVVQVDIQADILTSVGKQAAAIEIKTDQASYALPIAQINQAIQAQFGSEVATENVSVQIEIGTPTQEKIQLVQNVATQGGYTLLAPAMEFTVTISDGTRTQEVSEFTTYVERTIALPEGIDHTQTITGIIIEADGSTRHVPTQTITIDGKHYAKLSSLTNSTYALIQHTVHFNDMAHHWAQATVYNLGARSIVTGTEKGNFQPNEAITRAEFAMILVRGLGLKLDNSTPAFNDVAPNTWYSQAIQAAYKYALINGMPDGTFRPNEPITREQAFVILARAMQTTGLTSKLPALDIDKLLSNYRDATSLSPWAESGVATTIQAGLVTGRGNHELAPQASITRAEVATILYKLLQRSNLID